MEEDREEVKLDKQAATTTSDFERLIQLSVKPNSVTLKLKQY